MNIKRIIEACRLSEQEAMDFFHVNKKGLEDLIAGKSSLNMEGALAVSKKFNLSLDYVIKGEIKGHEDEYLEKRLNDYDAFNTRKETDARVQKLMKDNGFNFDVETLYKFYHQETGKVVIEPLIDLDNPKLYFLLRDNKVGIINFGRGHGIARKANSWEDADKAVIKLFGDGKLKNPGWVVFALDSFDKYESQKYLDGIKNGKFSFDPNIILKLLDKGAVIRHTVGGDEYNSGGYENDYIETALLKDYCLRLLKK